jgi:poly(3-hydroxybutyrate) depolymerase
MAGAVLLCLSITACGGGGPGDEASAASATELAASVPTQHATAARRVAARPPAIPAAPNADGTTSTTANGDTLQVAATLPGFPHTFDVYRPANATKAIVFLHGLGGYGWQIAYDLGLNSVMASPTTSTVNWAWLEQNHVIAIFPQGQVPAGSNTPTWSDYVQHSGADDVGFLKALSAYAKSQLGATEVALSGHSNGGAMTARVWCEATTSYKAFVSLAGPMPSTTYPMPAPTCTPLSKAPYYAVLGGADTTLQAFSRGAKPPTTNQISVGLTNSILVAEWSRHRDRSSKVCGTAALLSPTSTASYGPSWDGCNSQVRFTVVEQADHPIASLEMYMGMKMADLIRGFVQQ